ncbi:Rid family detoxifying hydrolase [Rathayibacter sp. YIM 133350]|uniref:RidA family protein n=1 Tax=Rathayibacter sp. YIM 133350 TaxID=3131992 RepID=UPI00307F8FA0
MPRSAVSDPAAPQPVGPYSHAASGAGDLIYLSGQTPIDPSTGALVDGGIQAQTEQVFANLASVLAASKRDFGDVVKVNVYLIDMADFEAMNSVYARVFSPPYPARTTVAVAGLPLGARVEVEMLAGSPSDKPEPRP